MADNAIAELNRVTAAFTIKVPHPEVQYASLEATVFTPLTIPDGSDADDVETLANQALGIAKRSAAEALGIETTTEVTEAGVERVTVMVEKAFGPGVKKETAPTRSTGGGNYQKKGKSSGGGGGRGPKKTEVGQVTVLNQINAELPEWVESRWLDLVEQGKIDSDDNELWDNRKFSPEFGGNGNPNAPWFKTSGGGVALDFGGEWKS